MDVGNFISDLLAQHGDVSVPGLGYFALTRVNGHYNEPEGKIYPPTFSVQFDPQLVEDETLAQYMADKKNISLASSKYFTDKYINNIKLQAQAEEVALADLGWFYTEGDQLFFRPAVNISSDPEFFCYEPLSLYKLGAAPVQAAPAYTTPNTADEQDLVAPVVLPNEEQPAANGQHYEIDEEHEAYLIELTRKKSRNSTILFIVLAAALIAGVVYLVDRYNPNLFNQEAPKAKPAKTAPVITAKVDTLTPADTTSKTVKPDSTVTAVTPPATDTITKSAPIVNNKITGPRYEVMAGAFKTIAAANLQIARYERMGFEAHIAEGVPGRKYNITLGTYRTKGEAAAALDKILNTGKLKEKDVYVRPLGIK
ncbi:MAG: SPOR domain-containing protein [Bacteroidota bacterium]